MFPWIELVLGVMVATVGFGQRSQRWTVTFMGGLLMSMAIGDLLPEGSVWLWVARGAWLAFLVAVLLSVPRQAYRAARVQLILLAASVVCIVFTVIPGLPQIVRMLVLVAGITLFVAAFAVGIYRIARFPAPPHS